MVSRVAAGSGRAVAKGNVDKSIFVEPLPVTWIPKVRHESLGVDQELRERLSQVNNLSLFRSKLGRLNLAVRIELRQPTPDRFQGAGSPHSRNLLEERIGSPNQLVALSNGVPISVHYPSMEPKKVEAGRSGLHQRVPQVLQDILPHQGDGSFYLFVRVVSHKLRRCSAG